VQRWGGDTQAGPHTLGVHEVVVCHDPLGQLHQALSPLVWVTEGGGVGPVGMVFNRIIPRGMKPAPLHRTEEKEDGGYVPRHPVSTEDI